ncbi:MAG: hypothetical protein ACTSQB_00305 [Candidatus Heimdallarchaeota archaeon]
MEWNKAYKRLTRKYNADCKELDDWSDEFLEYFEIEGEIIDEQDEGDYSKYLIIVTKKSCLSEKEIYEFLKDEYVKGCSCEHDCCGHYFGGINKVIRILDNRFMLSLSYAPNY